MPAPRHGLTLLELLAVVAILLVLGALIPPTVRFLSRDTKVLAAADLLRGRIADARGEAMEHGLAYRLALSQDGGRVRIAPDDQGFGAVAVTATEDESAPRVAEDELPKGVAVTVEPPDGSAPAADADGWTRVATFQPDGTCREDAVAVRIRQPSTPAMPPLVIRIRGLTGAATVEKEKGGRP